MKSEKEILMERRMVLEKRNLKNYARFIKLAKEIEALTKKIIKLDDEVEITNLKSLYKGEGMRW